MTLGGPWKTVPRGVTGADRGINFVGVSVRTTQGQEDYSIDEEALMDLGVISTEGPSRCLLGVEFG